MAYSSGFFVLSLISLLFVNSLAMVTFDITQLGAMPDGVTDSTPAFRSAWQRACGSSEPATIYVPEGTFLLTHTLLKGPCKNGYIFIQIDGFFIAPSDYYVLKKHWSWILFQNVGDLSIQGGVFDGRGSSLWDCKATSWGCPRGARTLAFYKSRNVNVTGLTSMDSQRFHIEIYQSQNIKLDRVTVSAPGKSPNTDGIHVGRSDGITILNSNIGTGDDCISIGPGSTNLWIENINCGPGHGISIGSLGWKFNENGVRNVTAKLITLVKTQNGMRIKTWARPSNSYVNGVRFENVTVENVKHPIVIDQNYCRPDVRSCPDMVSGIRISDISFADVRGTSASKVAVKFDCSWKNPCTDIKLEDVRLKYKDEAAEAWCSNVSGRTSGVVEPGSCFDRN